jgi:hypothetical protein
LPSKFPPNITYVVTILTYPNQYRINPPWKAFKLGLQQNVGTLLNGISISLTNVENLLRFYLKLLPHFVFRCQSNLKCNFLHIVHCLLTNYNTSVISSFYGNPIKIHPVTQQNHSLTEVISWAREFGQFLYLRALSKWDLTLRLYDFLPLRLGIKKTTISAYTSFWGAFYFSKENLPLWAVIANLCSQIYKCPLILQKKRFVFSEKYPHFRTWLRKPRP